MPRGKPNKKLKEEISDSESDPSSSEESESDYEDAPKKRKQVKTSKQEESDDEEGSDSSENDDEEIVTKATVEDRVRSLNQAKLVKEDDQGLILYWMCRDQRVDDNWALVYAQDIARKCSSGLAVIFTLSNQFDQANSRQLNFMIKGLKELDTKLRNEFSIPFVMLHDLDQKPVDQLSSFVKQHNVRGVICDFSPLKPSRQLKQELVQKINIPIWEVDAHNVVPVWKVSDKQEWAAKTIRPKIHKLLGSYLTDFPKIEAQKNLNTTVKLLLSQKVPWQSIDEIVKKKTDPNVTEVDWIAPGEKAAREFLDKFFENRLKTYNEHRNDPTKNGQSNLSPYLHLGILATQRVVLESQQFQKKFPKSYASFIEELVVRRELSDNWCFYNSKYDTVDGFPDWAKQTLREHEKDKREHVYSLEQFEKGKTYDDLWNAAQHELVFKGKMHGFMRMYWAKKILEWTSNARDAYRYALYLNDKYEMDGNDPNGYVGCAWSIGGVHDRGWTERRITGKIRYMNYEGCKRKFKVANYIAANLKKIK